jgi:hypothetical protein
VRAGAVRAAGESCLDTEATRPPAHKQVAGHFVRRLRARGVVGGRVGEPRGGIELEAAVHLIGRDVAQPVVIATHGF